ncbi:hypothetical protein GDO81_011784 [Engystomops pustulosus]|uniref:Uncharacterized protein n=1 Tax=Engystomops pustulosus TaxID=76066 RepID=A0AAV7BGR2_ENGPU|nr:hypothetical protein GDO81_011784 [Engystomops pustulosus]
MPTNTLSFNGEEAEPIISQATAATSEFKRRDWEREAKRLRAYGLHATTLAEYFRVGRIPGARRGHLRPTFFAEDPDYTKKFEGLLNKRCMDIILVPEDYLQQSITKLKEQMKATEQQLQDSLWTENTTSGEIRNSYEILRTICSDGSINGSDQQDPLTQCGDPHGADTTLTVLAAIGNI